MKLEIPKFTLDRRYNQGRAFDLPIGATAFGMSFRFDFYTPAELGIISAARRRSCR